MGSASRDSRAYPCWRVPSTQGACPHPELPTYGYNGLNGYSDHGTEYFFVHTYESLHPCEAGGGCICRGGLVRLSAWPKRIYSYVPIRDVDRTVLS